MKRILLVVVVAALSLSVEQPSKTQTKLDKTQPEQDKSRPKTIALKSGEPATLAYDLGMVRFLVTSEDTAGAWSLVELTEMPGQKTTWHRHNQTDQAYYVLEGVFTAKVEDKVYELPAGSYIFIPRGTPHGQGNFGTVPVKVLLTNTPGGFERYFRDRAELFKTMKPDHPDFKKRLKELRGKVDAEELGVWDVQK